MRAQAAETYRQSLERHISYVQEAGRLLGVETALLEMHDQSKWSEEEFQPYAEYFHGNEENQSPVDAERVSDDFVRAWLHHIHHNPHHWQHWIFPDKYSPKGSNVENGVVEMPRRYALEMVADWMGASKGYTGSWDMTEWLTANIPRIRLHSRTAAYLREVLDSLGYADIVNAVRFVHEQGG